MAKGEITIRVVKRADGTTYNIYQGEYRDRDGKRCFVSDKNKHEAQRKLRKVENEVEGGTHAKGNETLRQVIDEFIYDLEKRARVKEISRAGTQTAKENLSRVPECLRRMKMKEFKDTGKIQDEMRNLKLKYAIGTVQGTKQTLARVFTFATQSPRNYVPRSVMRDFPFSVGKQPKRKNMAEKSEAAILLRAARDRIGRPYKDLLSSANFYAMLCFVITTGMRPEEVCGLQITDIHRFASPPHDQPKTFGLVKIQHTNTVWDGFRQKLKNDDDNREILRLGKNVIDALDIVERVWQSKRLAAAPGWESCTPAQIKMRARRIYYGDGKCRVRLSDLPIERRTHGFVFVNPLGNPYNAITAGHMMRELTVEAGIVKRDPEGRILLEEDGKPRARISLYSFRHMVATHNSKLPPHIGAAVTGHSEQTYLSTYVHLMPEDQLRIAESLGALEDEVFEATATDLKQRLISG